MSTIFRSFVLNLVAQTPGTLNAAAGELAHGAFYAAVQAIDPQLAQRMHEAQERAAFTLSPLYGYWRSPQDKLVHVREGQPGWLRVTLLDDDLASVFFRFLLRQPAPILRLGDARLAIHDALSAPGSHPWAGYTTLTDLSAIDHAPDTWTMEFASPTAIRWGSYPNGDRRMVTFPMPRLAVAGLRSRWDKLTGQTWGRDFEEWVGQHVTVSCVWRWQVETFQFQRQTYAGGTGKLQYHLLDSDNAANAIHFHRLLRLAFYTGIGYKTTHGLGQVRVLQPGDPA